MKQLVIGSLFVALAVGGAAAAERPAAEQKWLKDLAGTAKVETGKAPLDQPLAPASGLELQAGEDGGTISFQRGWTSSGPDGFATRSVKVSAPLDDEGDGASSAALSDLASGATLEAKFSFLQMPKIIAADEDIWAFCKKVSAELAAADQMAAERAKALIDQCDSGNIALYAPERFREFQTLRYGKYPRMSSVGANARVGSSTFDYLDPTSLAKLSEDKTSWSVSGFYAVQRVGKPWLLTFRAEYQDTYEAQKKIILCPVVGSACLNDVVGAPDAVTRRLLSVDYRYSGKSYSAAATLIYDLKNDVFAIETPLYLTQDENGAYNGGLKLNWRSDTKDLVASIFVGRAFDLGMP